MQSLSMKILFVSGDGKDCACILDSFARLSPPAWAMEAVGDSAAGLRELLDGNYDACVLDLAGESSIDVLDFMEEAERLHCAAPVIVLYHGSDPRAGINAMRAGASDCIPRDRLQADCLERTILHAVERRRRQRRLQGLGELAADCPDFFGCAPDACIATDDRGSIQKANSEAAKQLGVEHALLTGRSLISLVAEECQEAFAVLLAEAGSACQSRGGELRLQPPALPAFWAEVRVSRNASETVGRNAGWYYWVVRDVSSCKQAEDELRQSESRFRLIAENIRDVFWIRTPEKMLYVSPAYEEIWGERCGGDPLDGDALVRSVHPEDRPRVEAAHRLGLRTGMFVEEYRIIRSDGAVRWIRTRSFPVVVDGVLDRIVGVAEDATAAKTAEEELRMERSSLKASYTALKVLMDQRERDREALQISVLDNLKAFVTPYLDRLKNTRLSDEQRSYVDNIATHIMGVALPFVRSLTERFLGLTPTEIRVAEMVRRGASNKEIAQALRISEGTVRSHREGLRRKLGLINQKVNLRSFLQLI